MLTSILFLGTQISIGGAQRVLLNQAQWFFNQGYKTTVVFFYDKENLKEIWDRTYPFRIIDLRAHRKGANPVSNFLLLLSGLFRLWKIIREDQFDLIETFTPDSNLLGLIIGWFAGIPIRIGSHHGFIERMPKWRSYLHGRLINLGFANCLVAVSEQVYQSAVNVEKIKPDRIRIIKNGIDIVQIKKNPDESDFLLRKELGLHPDDFVYLSVGRITQQKGHTYLLEAIPDVLKIFPDHTVFLIAGEGHLRTNLEKKSVDLKIDHVVRFLGNRSDVPNLLNLADVFVMPSLWEGLPLALLEAMSVGLPVVVTNVEGVASLIVDGEHGYLLEPKDVEALTTALLKIRENEAARNKFSNTNRELIARDYTTRKMCSEYEALFLEMYRKESLKR